MVSATFPGGGHGHHSTFAGAEHLQRATQARVLGYKVPALLDLHLEGVT